MMQKIYRAYDGTEFDTEADCITYETDSKPSMWDVEGIPTNEPLDAKYVYFPNEFAAKIFMIRCPENERGGIDEGSIGLFMWDEIEETYIYIDEDEFMVTMNVIHELHPNLFEEKLYE